MPSQSLANIVLISVLHKLAISDTLLSLAPVDVKKIPYLNLFITTQIWIFLRLAIPFSLANASSKSNYDNKTPRKTNTPEHLGDLLYKLQCAHENTLEAIVIATVATVTAANLGLDPIVFAKLSTFALMARLVYPYFYVWGPDMIRSIVFSFGFFSSVMAIVYSLFPQLI